MFEHAALDPSPSIASTRRSPVITAFVVGVHGESEVLGLADTLG